MLFSLVIVVLINIIYTASSSQTDSSIYDFQRTVFFNDSNNNPHLIYTWPNGTIIRAYLKEISSKSSEIDCLGLGSTIARALQWLFLENDDDSTSLDVRFFLTSRKQPRRVEVVTGDQFGLEWTDFKIERRTVIIVHGFLSHGEETWIKNMQKAFLLWGDVNVVVVDWSAHGNTWNYYRAAVNSQVVGEKITQFLSHIVNATRDSGNEKPNWGPIHMVGHSLGAHICGLTADEFKNVSTSWKIERITGLDPAQPCIANTEMSLDLTDAKFVDIIHTNAPLTSKLGFGLPNAIGHVDFYPNGGRTQPGCIRLNGLPYLGIPRKYIEQAICSHGRSYIYFTESIIGAAIKNSTFLGYHWDKTYLQAMKIINETSNELDSIEMGINAEKYSTRGTFFVMTSSTEPFSELKDNDKSELSKQLSNDFRNDYLD